MGAHTFPFVRPILLLLLLLLTISSSLFHFVSPEDGSSDIQALLTLKNSLSNAISLSNWNPTSTSPCPERQSSWTGVICSNGKIWGLQLENMSLSGEINIDSLMGLPQLRTLSFMNNNFEGPLPDVKKLGALKSLYLSNNRFSGEIMDDAFKGMASLKKVYIANNRFTGNIPTSLASSPRLLELRLEGNLFVGRIPDFPKDLKVLNVSNNQLEGPIPGNLTHMDPSSFSGNIDLCGQPLDSTCDPSSPPPSSVNSAYPPVSSPSTNDSVPDDTNKKTSPLRIVVIVIAGLVALVAIVVLLVVYRDRSRKRPQIAPDSQFGNNEMMERFSSSSPPDHKENDMNISSVVGVGFVRMKSSKSSTNDRHHQQQQPQQHGGKLSFVREDRTRFELQDLMRASAEVLGNGRFGSSYKAVLMEPEGQAVVVKRFKQMSNVGKEDFHEHMRRLGRLKHPNLLPLVAYYYRKEEKLLVFDFVHNGSLAARLHGKRNVEKLGLDWPTRLKIIKGVAKGLTYLHNELPSVIVPHGHLKSSNVLLGKSFEPLLMDYALLPLVNPEQAHDLMMAYKSPEFFKQGRVTKKTDVWNFGILILELLTGKFPVILSQGRGTVPDNAAASNSWVNSIQHGSLDDFDKEMDGSTMNAQGEMLKLLRIGVACCDEESETRLDLKEAVERIGSVNERDNGL